VAGKTEEWLLASVTVSLAGAGKRALFLVFYFDAGWEALPLP